MVIVKPDGALSFSSNLSKSAFSQSDSGVALFVKRGNEPLSPQNIRDNVDVHGLKGSPLATLLSSLQGIWFPALLQNEAISEALPNRVKQLLTELKTSLPTTIAQISSSNRDPGSGDLNNVSDIFSPADEFAAWIKFKEDRRSPYRGLAKAVDAAFADINGFTDIKNLTPSAVAELIDLTFDALNNVWNADQSDEKSYPEQRMIHLFDLLGKEIFMYVQKKLADCDLWGEANGRIKTQLSNSARLLEQWCEVPRRLTSTFWSSGSHAWSSRPHEDSLCSAFARRLDQIVGLLTIADELKQIIPPSERSGFNFDRLFDPLKAMNPLFYNPYTEPQWSQAVKEFERRIEPVESSVAATFRREIAPFMDNAQMLLEEFLKCKNLMNRPSIRRAIVSERETLMTLLREKVKQMENAIDRGEILADGSDDEESKSSANDNGLNYRLGGKSSSQLLSVIIRLRQIGAKVADIFSTSKTLFEDLDGFSRFSGQCESVLSKVKAEQDNRFENWLQDVNQKVAEDDASMQLTGSLLGWREGILVVNFPESIVRFLRDYRQLDELGFELPKPGGKRRTIADFAIDSEKYFRFGILLKKTANFYNSISEQIVDVQEQLLLGSLTSFGNLVSNSTGKGRGSLTWSSPGECESFVKTLQSAAEKLSSENRALRKVHEWLCAQTVGLMGIELHRQNELWKSKWRQMKEKMQSIKSKYNEKDSKLWVLHWDHQVYKALEASYQMGLECINESIPDIKIELVFTNKVLDFKPPLEQIRQSYYRELKKFVNIPYTFEGFGNAHIYKKMGPRNSKRLLQVYAKAEALFERLQDILFKYQEWTILGQVDLDAYIEQNVKTSEEYITNFKMLRAKRKDIDKLPDLEKIDCCSISLVPFKSYLDDLLLRVGDVLLITLRRSLIEEFKEVDQFLEQSNEKLNKKPRTVEEIGDAKKQWKEIDSKRSYTMHLSRNCVEKKKLLLQYAPGTAIDISDITAKMANLDGEGGRWDDFDIAMEAHNDIIEQQKEVLKTFLEEEEVTINVEIDKFASKWKQLKPSDTKSWDPKDIQKIFDSLDDWKKQFAVLETRTTKHIDGRLAFGMQSARFDGLEALQQDLTNTSKSWDMLKEYMTEEKTISDEDWISFTNVYVLQDFAAKWADNLKATFSRGTYDSVAEYIVTKVERIKKSVPALKYCKSDAFKEDHWTELLQGKLQLSKELRVEKLKVEHFLSRLEILMEPATLSFVKALQARALGEVQIREAMHELRAWELSAELKFLTQEESGRSIPLIKEWKDLFLEIGDKQSLLGSLKESPFFKAFSDVGLALEAKMTALDYILHTSNAIQRKWVYLEPIFSRGALPAEESRFRRVDENFKDIMNTIVKDPKLFYLADEQYFPKLSDNLRHMLDQLERCQKALTEFLEAKRSSMPRFYFIGDDDLLEILGQAKNPAVIQSHLKKLFQGIHKVKFDPNHKNITAMLSSANEVVDLEKPVQVTEKVEDWLEQLAQEMRATLSSLLGRCLGSKQFDWNYPSQILCLCQNIRFTEQAEAAIEGGPKALQALRDQLEADLREFTSHDLSSEPLLQLKMKSLVMDLVHNLDVVDQLRHKGTRSVSDWQWSKQLRYYHLKGKTVVRMHDAEFEYTFEYQGNAPKLVHTPLTDRCYLTLTQGMRMGFGGNPYGPAGTGKTESVKALASCLGRQVLVFNCDEALESTSMVRIFIGIVKCGAWGCFDEFNRLKEDQLSAISQQIQIIQDAIKTHTSPIPLLGRSIDVNFNSGIFVTLNPAGKGYGGRSKLPDNLKALFRPVAMGAPDNELIAEVSLVTEGFTAAKDLASKIVSLFKLSRQLLSAQQHYDWGLRALKAVLNSGGRLIQMYKQQGTKVDATIEYEILIKAVRVNTLSKLTYADTVKFLALIGDVFPGVKSADITGGELEEAIKHVMKEKPFFLVEEASQIKKMIQLKESLDQRMGCVVVGPSGCGKSTLWRVLKAAMIKCGQPVVTYVMNPKSMPRERLLGHMDIDTREWADGVLTDAARKVVKESSDVHCWIICDGDVDPEWIESLNSVLDDNHLLTLPNGERISFGPNVNFLFETHDLRFASPATVSRMGMIFLSDEDLDVGRLVQKWLTTFPEDKRMAMSSWIDELFYKSLDFVVRCDSVVETTLVGTIMNGLSQIRDATTKQEFICGLIRGIGGNLSISNRSALAKEIFQWSNERPPDLGAPLDCYASGSSFVGFSSAGSSDMETIQVKDIGYTSVVPTVSVQRTMAMLDSWITHMEPFILVGPEGCGKSMIINHAFRKRRNVGIATLNCNAQTTSDDIISKIAQTCSLFSSSDGRVYRPRDCERLVLYLKDINLPRPDMYDTCQLIAFLQQIITFGGFYDEALEFLRLERIQIVASMNAATTVGRHPLSTRFTAVVRIGVLDYSETNELVSVYDSFLNAILKSVPISDNRWVQKSERERLANFLIEVYQKTREKFTVDDRRHYLFTPRDVTIWVKNLCRYNLEVDNLLDVLAYEAQRVFRDRLVGGDSRSRFDQQLSGSLRTQFRHPVPAEDMIFSSLSLSRGPGGGASAAASNKKGEGKESDAGDSASFGGVLSKMNEVDFNKLVSQGILYYEREERDLNMLLFPEILHHIAHIDRVISGFSGHLLLAGQSGVGRRNAATIAAYMLGYRFYTPSITRNYGSKQFNIDVKTVLEIAGVQGEHVVLLVEDFQITKESILETLNSLISSGEAPGLYTHEELEPLMGQLRKIMDDDEGARTPYEFFVQRIRKFLHIVLCMDPSHPRFLYRCESNPAIYAQCTVLWIGEWTSQALKEIPLLIDGVRDITMHSRTESSAAGDDTHRESKRGGGEGKRGMESKSEVKHHGGDGDDAEASPNHELIETIVNIHDSCVSMGATPKDYVSFLKCWYALYNLKKKELLVELGHLEAGLSKLDSAAEVVHDLRTNAKQQEKDLRVAQAAADRAMEEISKAITSSTDRRNEVGEIKRTVAENEEKTSARKAEIENELAEIQPILDTAKQAVGSIRNEHLNEIRSLTAPPEAIADVLAAVLMLLGVQDLSWLSMKKFLGNRGVKEDILNYDAKRIDAELRKNVAKLLKKKPASFDDANIQRVSVAAAPMAAWVKANIRYSLVIEKIEPLQIELEEEIAKLEQSQKRLKRCEDELQEIDTRIDAMKKEFAARTAEAERLKANLSIAGTTLDKAEKLIGQLSGEQTRWKTQAGQLRGDLSKLPLKMLLAAGFSTYLAKTPEDVRSTMLNRWQEVVGIQNFSFKRTLTTESELLQWKGMGLPSDDLSQENGLVIRYAQDRVPFIIDPASAASSWLKTILGQDKNRPLEVVTQFDSRFLNQVELAVRFGKTLLIFEADGLEPALYPLCRKDLCHQGPRYVVTIGDKTIDYNENFQMYLVTRNPQPDIPPDASALLSVVNFTVTRSGLEGQLLALAIHHEQPELELAKGEMLKREEDFKVQLARLEKDLLEALATAEGNLLENTTLIESLTKTKEKSAEIEDALVKSAEASVKLDQQREVYRSFATSGAKLFFLVKYLQNVCHMYQFSLMSFLSLYKEALAAETKAKSTEERLSILIADMEVRVLYFVGRALFKADRPMFALHLVRGMHKDHFQPKEWEVFTGAVVASVSDALPKGYPSWAPSERKDAFRLLSEQLPHLVNALELENAAKWQRFASSLEAERDLPSLRGVSLFQRVLIVQAFRPDRLQSAIMQFCIELLRIESLSPPPISLPTLFSEISPVIPLLLISSPGADASKELQEYAAKTVGAGNYEEIAMGGGQQDAALHLLRQAAQNGSWLCLQNLHLVVSWLPKLEKEIAALNPHSDFRLILTTESHNQFTSILLQTSLKATFESPPGIKKNLQRTFDAWDPELFDANNPVRGRLLFLLACFHAVMQERRTFIPQGWTKFYEFSYGDLKAGTYVVEAVTEALAGKKGGAEQLDWEVVNGLMEDAIYGGRIDNAYDIRVLRGYLRMFFSHRLASDAGSGVEVLPGTPLRMPSAATADYKTFKKILTHLPDVDAPFVFQLPDNIERSLQRTTSSMLIRQLRLLATGDIQAAKYDREKWRAQLNPILEQWAQLTSSGSNQGVAILQRSAVRAGKNSKGGNHAAASGPVVDPVDDFVQMEFTLAGEICSAVDGTLSALKKVLFGSGLLTPQIQAAAMALLAGEVPAEWQKLWEIGGPEKPQAWLRELVRKRVVLGSKWMKKGSSGGQNILLSQPLNLSDLFHPSTFLNALRQQTARQLNAAIDQVKLICSWERDGAGRLRGCPMPCTLTGLLLQGSTFHSVLRESAPEAAELTPVPDVTVGFVPLDTRDTYGAEAAVTVPIYLTPSREDLLSELQMPLGTANEQDRWVLSGVALFLREEDA
jgi:dynein heavy chain 2